MRQMQTNVMTVAPAKPVKDQRQVWNAPGVKIQKSINFSIFFNSDSILTF